MNSTINVAIKNLYKKLSNINIHSLKISEYNKAYLSKYINNYNYYMPLYKQLLSKAIDKLNKPVEEVTFVDYGGGCGILSCLAKETGFKKVIYNDIYTVSVADAQTIAGSLNIYIDYFVEGDIEQFVSAINKQNIKPDLICSFDVLEHIYNWKHWLQTIIKISSAFSLLCMTSANTTNPIINRRLRKIQMQAEYKGFEKDEGWKASDLNTSFLEERKKIIAMHFKNLQTNEISLLAKASRGFMKDDILNLVAYYLQSGEIKNATIHSTNTCDPYTGNWVEHLIDTNELKSFAQSINLQVAATNAYYSYSKNKLLNVPKYFMNVLMKIAGKRSLFFSPVYVLEIDKR